MELHSGHKEDHMTEQGQKMSKQLGVLIDALMIPEKEQMLEIGTKIGQLYTNMGYPIDMSLQKLQEAGYGDKQLIVVLHGALGWRLEHLRRSGATDKAVERTRKTNRADLERYINTGESGVY